MNGPSYTKFNLGKGNEVLKRRENLIADIYSNIEQLKNINNQNPSSTNFSATNANSAGYNSFKNGSIH